MANDYQKRGNGKGGGNVHQLPPREPPTIDGRPPPHDLDAECAVLSAIMIDAWRIVDVLWLRPEHFYSEAHNRIWEAILWLRAAGQTIDIVTIGTRLKDQDRIGQVGGMPYLTEIINAAAATSHLDAYARTVVEKARLRLLIATLQRTTAQCYIDTSDAPGIFAEITKNVTDIASTSVGNLRRITSAEIFAPISKELPWLCKGLRLISGRVGLFAGYAYSGKTMALQSLALSVATGKSVWGGFEVSRVGKVVHMNWDQPGLDTNLRYQRLAAGLSLTEADLRGRLEVIQYPKCFIDNEAGFAEIRAICRDTTLLVMDALTGAAGDIDENSPAIGRALYQLGAISEETGCTILVIHHAGKPGEDKNQRGKKQPAKDPLHALRGSSSIAGAGGSVFVMGSRGGDLYNLHQARTPTLAGKKLDPFALRFVDVQTEGIDRDFWPVRVQYVSPDELREDEAGDDDQEQRPRDAGGAAARLEQVAQRLLAVVVARPGLSSGELAELVPVQARLFDAAKALLERTNRIANRTGKRTRPEWVAQ